MISIYEAEKFCEKCRKLLKEQNFNLEFSEKEKAIEKINLSDYVGVVMTRITTAELKLFIKQVNDFIEEHTQRDGNIDVVFLLDEIKERLGEKLSK